MSTTTEKQFKIECDPDNAQHFFHWIKTRGGVAKWRSVNLSNPGASWSTPTNDKDGKPYTRPTWQADSKPEVIVTDPKEIGVYVPKLYKAFPVGIRRGSGLSFKITDAAQRKVDKYLDECKLKHGDSFYRKGVLDIGRPSIGIYYTESIQPLDEWITQHGPGHPEEWE